MRIWWLQVLIAFDQLFNALLGGWADETLSAHAYRQGDWRMKVIDTLFFWQPNHCRAAYESEMYRKQLPSIYSLKEPLVATE